MVDATNDCLALSSARTAYLLRQGVPARCVIGVRLNPFSAHAWVQCGDVAIAEDLDFARRYVPVAAL